MKSKTLAERAAWAFDRGEMELTSSTRVLGWRPRPTDDVIVETGRSLREGGYA
ncbi:hypothetical protein Aph01nite_57610 [Acrocarpospora phusangensis]|uniref:Uncharacterized protein n=1 Tax=Acrocarpospora phusangensis TaxID=1070424 RepID=A0A919UML0_9ACTN|nr:hypothetical protein [Acrocarpospora phusangensis]GIH27451.1 hypothetical protein Aph01nite_57610 [Acrocarpospora phusangensis]